MIHSNRHRKTRRTIPSSNSISPESSPATGSWIFIGVFLTVIAAYGIGLPFLAQHEDAIEQRDWDRYSEQHHCIFVSRHAGHITGMMVIGGTSTYHCDAGEIVVR